MIRLSTKQLAKMQAGTAPPPPRESEIQRNIIAYLEMLGAVVVRCNSGVLVAADGRRRLKTVSCSAGSVSDILAVYCGRFCAFEVKRPKGKPTVGQSQFLDAVLAAGGVAAVVCSIEDVERVINAGMLAEPRGLINRRVGEAN
jgi:hypothetical protein